MRPPVATLHLLESAQTAHEACAPASAPGPWSLAVPTSGVTTFQQGVTSDSQVPGAQWGWGLGHRVPLLGPKGHCPLAKWDKKGIREDRTGQGLRGQAQVLGWRGSLLATATQAL